jgi:dolichyl-phosphate-mannose-protein mannosyltransferase
VPAGDYIEGAAVFGAMMAGVVGGSWLVLKARLPHLTGVARAVAFALLATLGILVVHVVPLTLGVLSRGSVLAATVVWVAVAWLARPAPTEGRDAEEPQPTSSEDRRAWVLATVGIGIVGALMLALLSDRVTTPSTSIDVLNFHLPGVVRWIETGSLWQIDVFLPDVAPGNYPNNGDVILLATVLPWKNDFLAHFAMYPFFVLTGVATYAIARELGASRAAGALAGCLVLAIPAVSIPVANGLVDAVMLFTFAAGILFLLRHGRTDATSDLVLAGLALGVAMGTKWYGVSAVAIVFVTWVATAYVAWRDPRVLLRQAAALLGLIVLAGGIWLLRNWIESGNPFFPVKVELGGITIFDAPPDTVRDRAGFTILDYVGDWGAPWSDFILPQLRRALAAPAVLIGIGFALLCALLVARRHVLSQRALLAVAAVAAGLIALAYTITPYTAGGPEGFPLLVGADSRYLIPALVIAAAAGAVVAGAVRWGALALGVLAIAALVDGARWASGGALAAADLDASTWIPATIATLALLWGGPLVWRRLELARRPAVLATAGALAVAVAVAGGYEVQKRFNDDRYVGFDPAIDFLVSNGGSGSRIGLAGVWDDLGISPVLPAFGTRFGNQVDYIGQFEGEMLRRYPTEAEFESALERGGYDFLVIGKGRFEDPDVPERGWAEDAGYEPVAESSRLVLLQRPTTA